MKNDAKCKKSYFNCSLEKGDPNQKEDKFVEPKGSLLLSSIVKECLVPFPHLEMPHDVKEIYIEARMIFPKSSMAAAVLLQLAMEILLLELGYNQHNIHELITYLEKQEIPEHIKNELKLLRIYENKDMIHTKKNDLYEAENGEKVRGFFELINIIVEESIMFLREKNKKIDFLEA